MRNIAILAREYPDRSLLLRMPVIPGYNDDSENLEAIAAFLRGLGREIPLELLPYHAFGKVKYDNLGLVYEPELRGVTPPSQERMEQLQAQFEQMGVQIVHT